jgi:hypothetical protein
MADCRQEPWHLDSLRATMTIYVKPRRQGSPGYSRHRKVCGVWCVRMCVVSV